jgi:hypothetical protein
MRLIVTMAAFALVGVGVVRADDVSTETDKPTVKFDGATLLLAWQNSQDKPTIREFVPEGQDLETWTILASIRDYPEMEDPFLVCGAMAKRATELNADAQGRVTENKETGAAVVDFLAWPEDKSFVEFNVFRYRKADQGGLVAEQYAVRDYKDPDGFVRNLKPLRERLVRQMLEKTAWSTTRPRPRTPARRATTSLTQTPIKTTSNKIPTATKRSSKSRKSGLTDLLRSTASVLWPQPTVLDCRVLWEILQEVVDGIFSGGDYLGFDSIDELNSGDHVRQQC